MPCEVAYEDAFDAALGERFPRFAYYVHTLQHWQIASSHI